MEGRGVGGYRGKRARAREREGADTEGEGGTDLNVEVLVHGCVVGVHPVGKRESLEKSDVTLEKTKVQR